MSSQIKGQQILDALAELKEPARLADIVNHVAPSTKQPKSKLLKTIKSALDVGVQYGYIEHNKDHYYTAKSNATDTLSVYEGHLNDAPTDSDSDDVDDAPSEEDVGGSNKSPASSVRSSRSRSVNTLSAQRKLMTDAAKANWKLDDAARSSSECYGNQRAMRRRSVSGKRNRSRRSRAPRSRRRR